MSSVVPAFVCMAGSSPAPLLALPPATRKRVMELVFHCPSLPDPLLDRLSHWLRTPGALDEDERGFVLEVRHTPPPYKTTRRAMQPPPVASLKPVLWWLNGFSVLCPRCCTTAASS